MLAIALTLITANAKANPYLPANDRDILAVLPAGARYSDSSARELSHRRIDLALHLAWWYITQARSSGDLRFLGYAESVLAPWLSGANTNAEALVLHATVLQSRHGFTEALIVLDQALQLTTNDAQAWLTRATILRVLGRYDEAMAACQKITGRAGDEITQLCTQSLRGLMGNLPDAYQIIAQMSSQNMPNAERAWRDSELGEMAVRMGRENDAEHWFQNGLRFAPEDFYIKAAYADLLLRTHRPKDVLTLLRGQDSIEPLLLRITIAQKQLGDKGLAASRARLSAAFAAETQRGEGIHRREQARFLLEVEQQPQAGLQVAIDNWQLQHETDDVLVLIYAAKTTHSMALAQPALEFVRAHNLQDVRIESAATRVASAATWPINPFVKK